MDHNKNIDSGLEFDFGKTSSDYAKYRDIYPKEIYKKIIDLGLCTSGQYVLDIGTGTGVLPRNLYKQGAKFVGTDISHNQIEQAKMLAYQNDMDIDFICAPSEEINFLDSSFDVVTACQCFFYFDHDKLASKLSSALNENGKLAVIYMAWLPDEDMIAGASEKIILKYNPFWTGCNETRRPIGIPNIYNHYFHTIHNEIFDLYIPFTRESWNGRIKTCRGIGATLNQENINLFEKEHMDLLDKVANNQFKILHYCAISVLQKNN